MAIRPARRPRALWCGSCKGLKSPPGDIGLGSIAEGFEELQGLSVQAARRPWLTPPGFHFGLPKHRVGEAVLVADLAV